MSIQLYDEACDLSKALGVCCDRRLAAGDLVGAVRALDLSLRSSARAGRRSLALAVPAESFPDGDYLGVRG